MRCIINVSEKRKRCMHVYKLVCMGLVWACTMLFVVVGSVVDSTSTMAARQSITKALQCTKSTLKGHESHL